jgi:hypothetical protein
MNNWKYLVSKPFNVNLSTYSGYVQWWHLIKDHNIKIHNHKLPLEVHGVSIQASPLNFLHALLGQPQPFVQWIDARRSWSCCRQRGEVWETPIRVHWWWLSILEGRQPQWWVWNQAGNNNDWLRNAQFLWNPHVHLHHHKSLPLDCICSQLNPVYIFSKCFSTTIWINSVNFNFAFVGLHVFHNLHIFLWLVVHKSTIQF